MLKITSDKHVDDVFDIHTAMDLDGEEPIVSCVALYRKGWVDGWPALGGTRWISPELSDPVEIRQATWGSAKELAISMAMKNNLLRNAERALSRESERWRERTDLFGWQGGKGVIWAPPGRMTPNRLLAHGRLIESLGGAYVGSKDQGVGTRELKWISMSTGFTIGLGCLRDTGEGTAAGVLASMYSAAFEAGLLSGTPIPIPELIGLRDADATAGQDGIDESARSPESRNAFQGLRILILGLGKVGLPLTRFLHERGADCYVLDPALSELGPAAFYRSVRSRGAAVSASHAKMLEMLASTKRIFRSEREALADPGIQVISPTGGQTGWLTAQVEGGQEQRFQIIARAASAHQRLILGAGNDQLPATASRKLERDEALTALRKGDVLFVPDPIVSPGGVVAVSHERADTWYGYKVILDSAELAERSLRALFAHAERHHDKTATGLYAAFEEIALMQNYAD